MSQLTVIALILLVAGLWKFGPWNRRRRILSYEFPIGWWLHVGRIASDYESWPVERKSRFMDYVRLFVDRIEFLPSSSLEDEFEIKHRIAFATQAFLLFGHLNSDPIAHIEKFYVQRSSREPSNSIGLPRLFWEELDLNYITFFEVSKFGGSLDPYELSQLPNAIKNELGSDPDVSAKLKSVLGMPS